MTTMSSPAGESLGVGPTSLGGIERLRIRHLRFLELVAAGGSLSSAAERLALSQPVATKMLQDLESAFGVELVARTTRGAALSPAGLVALERMRIALSALGVAARSVRAAPPTPLLRLGILPLVGVTILPSLMKELSMQPDRPQVVVRESTVAGLLTLLRAGELDCIVGRVGPEIDAAIAGDLLITPLWEDRLAAACAVDNPIGLEQAMGAAELRELEWIVPPHGSHARQVFEEHFRSEGIVPPQAKVESYSFHTNLSIVANCKFLTVAAESAITLYANRGMVRRLRLSKEFPTARTAFIAHRDAASSTVLKSVGDILKRLVP